MLSGDVDLDLAMRVKNLVRDESILYSLSFTQNVGQDRVTKTGSNIWSAAGPQHELDFDAAIISAKTIFHGMFPDEEFLPRAPDPEEIVFGEDETTAEADNETTADGEASDNKDNKATEADACDTVDNKTNEGEIL